MRPFELLPQPFPCDYDPSEEDSLYFYKNFVKPMIPDMIQMMDTGLNIDPVAVEDLRVTIDTVLENVAQKLSESLLVQQYQKHALPAAQKAHEEKCTQAIRTAEFYLKDYNGSMLHRTWVVNTYLAKKGKLEDIRDKWSFSDVKQYNVFAESNFFSQLLNKSYYKFDERIIEGMQALAEYKAELWNRPREEKAAIPVTIEPFNPGSAKQKQEFFKMLGIDALAESDKTGDASWGRDQIEELLEITPDPELKEVLKLFVDHSYGGIIKTTFLKAFDSYTIDGVLHGNVKLFGAKSYRPTSNSPNLLNMPSTGSIYAKPLKKCFIAPKGKVILTADLEGLEDRGIANLSGDENKIALFVDKLDGHSMSATYYFRDRLEALIGPYSDNRQASKDLHKLVKTGNLIAEAIRQDSKPVSFGLAYGAFPPKVAATIKCSVEEARRIFDAYHNELYPGITNYRENYVLKTAKEQGYIHLGLGCRMYVSDAEKSIRTIANATVQFWSILTLIAVNELNHRIREAGFEEHIQVISTIYDSIYLQVTKEAHILDWANRNLIEVMTVQWLEDEVVHNAASAQVGYNWADLHKVPNNALPEEIEMILEKLDE